MSTNCAEGGPFLHHSSCTQGGGPTRGCGFNQVCLRLPYNACCRYKLVRLQVQHTQPVQVGPCPVPASAARPTCLQASAGLTVWSNATPSSNTTSMVG